MKKQLSRVEGKFLEEVTKKLKKAAKRREIINPKRTHLRISISPSLTNVKGIPIQVVDLTLQHGMILMTVEVETGTKGVEGEGVVEGVEEGVEEEETGMGMTMRKMEVMGNLNPLKECHFLISWKKNFQELMMSLKNLISNGIKILLSSIQEITTKIEEMKITGGIITEMVKEEGSMTIQKDGKTIGKEAEKTESNGEIVGKKEEEVGHKIVGK